ncbi:MAG: type II secretion system GspH family protein, partial [Candidatus Omnitrophica bacterium]|nr:type II secretion system GspH family protein [Candidatus Omnitrophota bacterium]
MRKNKHCLKCCVIGVTLIELMLVLVIIAVVGMAITGRMLSGIEKAKVLAAGRQLVSHIRLAQERAKLEQRNITCEFDAT